MNRWLAVAAAAWLLPAAARAYPVATSFTIDSAQSSLAVSASSGFLSDSDSKNLSGVINAVFDFGESGGFPPAASVTVTDAAIAPSGDYNLVLGFPPVLGVAITASDLVADISTPVPPASMDRVGMAGAGYQFDASQFVVTVDQGMIVVTGSANETTDLSMEPIIGTSEPGTFGTLTFTTLGTSGPYTHVGAALDFPISILETTETGGLSVDFAMTGSVKANASFYVALAGVPGDFDLDGDIDGADLGVWRDGFGTLAGATPADGNADGDGDVDGGDFLIWQRSLGTSPPAAAMAAIQAVPEPASLLLAAGLLVLALFSPRLCRGVGLP
ncbi:MAG TPA: hypothetical protein VF175_03015 [Lacipirellula sp.]